MKLPNTLRSGKLIRRYKRFFADIEYENNSITAHCPNPGSMTGLCTPGQDVLFSLSDNKKRKLPYTLEFVKSNSHWVGVNTQYPNKIVAEALENKIIPRLKKYTLIQNEFKFREGVRFDFLLKGEDLKPCIIEVKNVQLRRDLTNKVGVAEFPDSVTERGSKHLKNLVSAISDGYDCVMLYVVQRMDCQSFSIANDVDPEYAKNFDIAKKNGVKIEVWACDISYKEIKLSHSIKVI